MKELAVFTDAEAEAIAVQFAKARGDKGFTADEFNALMQDAASTRLANDLLGLVISRQLTCDWNGKEMLLGKEAAPQ